MTALETMVYLYENHAIATYSYIQDTLGDLATAPVKELAAAAKAFGVVPRKNTKASILEAVRDKIERRKSTAVRCNF